MVGRATAAARHQTEVVDIATHQCEEITDVARHPVVLQQEEAREVQERRHRVVVPEGSPLVGVMAQVVATGVPDRHQIMEMLEVEVCLLKIHARPIS